MRERRAGPSAGLDLRSFESTLGQYTPVTLRTGREFAADFRTSSYGDVHVSRVSASEHVAQGAAGESAPGLLVFGYAVRGSASIIQDGRCADVRAGDLFHYNPSRPYTLSFASDYELVGIVVPMRHLSSYARVIDSMTATRIDGSSGVGAIAATMLNHLEQGLISMNPSLRSRIIGAATDVIDTLCWQEVSASGLVADVNATRLQEAMDHMSANLDSPDLSPARLAAAMHVSVRTLYAIFEESGLSVSATIRSKRLERCAQDLRDPSRSNETISQIAARWGFSTPTSFTRTFRQYFGSTPNEYRLQHSTR